MSIDWTSLLSPVASSAVIVGGTMLGAVVTGLSSSAKAWLQSNNQAALGTLVSSAATVAGQIATTAAGNIAGKIQNGVLDYTDATAMAKEASNQVNSLLNTMPGELLSVAPSVATITNQVLANVGSQVLASPTLPSAPLNPTAAALVAAAEPIVANAAVQALSKAL